jgi:aspartyl-tRNA(Asn)/glutamyl-tRNA(Gln) amidotransferase subunit C
VAIDRDTVRNVATLSRLAMGDEELDRFAGHLAQILDYIDTLNQLDTSAVEPMSHALALRNVFRSDTPAVGLSQDDALVNAPDSADGFFRVPRIIE